MLYALLFGVPFLIERVGKRSNSKYALSVIFCLIQVLSTCVSLLHQHMVNILLQTFILTQVYTVCMNCLNYERRALILTLAHLPSPLIYVYANISSLGGDSSEFSRDLVTVLNKVFLCISPVAIPFVWYICIEHENII